MINELLILLLALAVHELTHFFHFSIVGLKPRFCWLGIGPAVETTTKFTPVRHVIVNITLAILTGMIFLVSMGATDLMKFAYIVGCFMDMNNIQLLIVYLWRKKITLDTNINDMVMTIKTQQIG